MKTFNRRCARQFQGIHFDFLGRGLCATLKSDAMKMATNFAARLDQPTHVGNDPELRGTLKLRWLRS